MNSNIIFMGEENVSQKIGEYILSQLNVNGNEHGRSGIVVPLYDMDGNLRGIDIHTADAAEEETAIPLFLDDESIMKAYDMNEDFIQEYLT